eukprot:jgi/Undpi1/12686/HiC_scaffold_6.g02354.m1
MSPVSPRPASPLYARLQLSISCRGLVNLDKLSKSDPFVVVKLHSPSENDRPVEIGRTEIISNSLNPKFVTIIPVTFKFEEIQTLHFEVYDVDTSYTTADATNIDPKKQVYTVRGMTEPLAQQGQDFQGLAQCALAQIVGGFEQTWEGVLAGGTKIKGNHAPAKVVIRAEEVANSNALVDMVLHGANLRKQGSNFLRISRVGETGAPIPCYKTEVAKTSQPKPWAPIRVSLQVLSNGDAYRPLLIEAFSWKKSGAHVLLGSCKASVNDLKAKADAGGQGLALDAGAGTLLVRSCTLTPQPSFFDYIAGGMQMAFSVAIDYTASNGDPSQPNTLHYHDPSGVILNEYGQAIQSVGGVLEYFDDDRRFPLYGFGGCPVYRAPASHCFAVNGNENDPEAAAMAASTITKDPSAQQYTILLLITDGAICDMDNTVEAIVAAADYPFSIVIVGVGGADYASMEALDGDDVRLVNRAGKRASRDIVQFVPMRDFVGKSSHALAKEVLAEIPGQVIEYMKANQILPGDPHRRRHVAARQGSVGSLALQDSFMNNGAAPPGSGPHRGQSQAALMHQGQPAAPTAPNAPNAPPQAETTAVVYRMKGAVHLSNFLLRLGFESVNMKALVDSENLGDEAELGREAALGKHEKYY